MSEARTTNPLVDQFRKGGVPPDLRLMAAQGALPLKTLDLVELLLILEGDVDESVRAAAGTTLAGLPAADLLGLLKDRDTLPEILAWSVSRRDDHDLRAAALQNRSTPDEAIEFVAAALPETLAELVVINQVRLLRRTSLLEALESNAGLNNDQRRRLRELRESFHIGETPPEPVLAPPPPPPEPEPEESSEPEEPPPANEDEAISRTLTEDEQKEMGKVSAVRRLYAMNTVGKIMAALKGNREERAVLIRDPNKLVAAAVLGSPRLTDAEVESFTTMKNISNEVLRKIGGHKEWTRRYPIIANLVKNPRTPIGISMGMVSRLNPRDLKGLSIDRNVPEPIRRAAQRFVKGQGQPGGKR